MKNTVNKSHMETEKVAIVFGDCTLGVKSGNKHYIFSYTRGGLESLNKNGKEWLYRETLPVGLKEETNQYEYRKFAFSDEIVEEAKQTVFQVQGKNIIFY